MNDGQDTFRPEDPATREEAAYAIAKAYKVTGTTGEAFVDQSEISEWAVTSVEALYSNGFISGNPDGTFAPKRTLTRADVVAMLDKITSELINVAGTYTDDVNGNLVVNTRDVILKDMTIKGNLYLTEGIGDGDVTLDGITVEGETFVNGGGLNSIKSKNSNFYKDMKVSAKNPVRIVIEGDAVRIEAFPGTTVTLTGNFSDVILPPGVNVVIKDATVGNIYVQPGFAEDKDTAKAVVTIEEGATVKNIQADAPVEVKGKGKIENLTVNSEGVKTEQKPEKTEVKDKEIKVEIAGKEETQDSIKGEKPKDPSTPSTPSTGGGSETPSQSKYRFTGKATYDGEAVGFFETEIYAEGVHMRGQTDENGNYSFTVPANKAYTVNVWGVDEDGFGYFTSSESRVANKNQIINIQLEKKHVAKIKVTDLNGKPLVSNLHIREVHVNEDKIEYESGGWNVDSDGYATVFLWNADDPARDFNIYSNDICVGKIEGIKRGEDLRTWYEVKVGSEVKDTIKGKAQYADGKPVKGKTVILDELEPYGQGYNYRAVATTKTNDNGEYSFDVPKANTSYNVKVEYQEEKDVFGSKSLNAVFAKDNPLIVEQSYSINVKATDYEGIGIASRVEIRSLDGNGGGYGHPTEADGSLLVYYSYLLPGSYTVTVTVGEEAIMKNITIKEGAYNYNLDFKFENVVRKPLNVELTNFSAVVGNANLVADQIELVTSDGKYTRIAVASIDKEGRATLHLPLDFNENKANVFISLNGVVEISREINIDDLNKIVEIDLAHELRQRELKVEISITTDAAIDFTVPLSIDLELKIGDGYSNKSVVNQHADSGTLNFELKDLIRNRYILSVNYKVGDNSYKFEKEIHIGNDGITEIIRSEEGGNSYVPIDADGFVFKPDSSHKLRVKLATQQ